MLQQFFLYFVFCVLSTLLKNVLTPTRHIELVLRKVKRVLICVISFCLDVALNSCKEVAMFGIKALKLAIKCHLEQDQLDLDALRYV